MHPRRIPVSALLGAASLLLSLAACDSAAPKGGDKPAGPEKVAQQAPPADGKAEAKAEAKAPAGPRAPAAKGKDVKLPKAPEAVRKAFWAGVQAGRKRTAAKDYAGAVASFDAALVQLPGHARALSGRGYAKLLAGDLDGAEADLRQALAAPGTKKLESAIAFNLGLVAEKRGDQELARAQFSLANVLHPSKAAQDKLAGAAECPVTVTYNKPQSELYASWKDVWKHLADEGVMGEAAAPADEAAAKQAVCTSQPLDGATTATFDGCAAPGGPWLVRHEYDFGGHALFVIEPADAGQWRVSDLGMAGGGRCGCDSRAAIADGVVTWELIEYAPIEVMEDAEGAIVDCEGEGDCFTACGDEVDASALVFVFSPVTASPTRFSAPLEGGAASFTVKVEGAEAVLSGGGCDRKVPLRDPKG